MTYFQSGIRKYRIQPKYCNVHLGFSKLLKKLVKYMSTYKKYTLKQDLQTTYLMDFMQFFCVCVVFF